MAGLLEIIARRLLRNVGKTQNRHPAPKKTVEKTVHSQPVRMKTVAPIVGPEKDCSSDLGHIRITLEKEMATERMNTENMKNETTNFTEEKNIAAEYAAAIQSINAHEKEDYLLDQIDEFRAKAQHLQDLLLTKESKVMELQELVDEREGKAKELSNLVDERQKKADGITEEVSRQIENLIDKVTTKMEQIGVSLGQELQEGQSFTSRQLEDLKSTLGSFTGQQLEDLKSAIGSMNEQQADELKNVLSSLNNQLELVKTDLSEKVHSENVKCYRNVSDLMKNLEDKLEVVAKVEHNIEKKERAIHGCTIAILVLTIINLFGLAASILLQLGIIRF